MCQPDIPDMPEYEEPKVAPAAPTPIQPDSMGTLPPPMSTSASDKDKAVLKKKEGKKKELQRTQGINRFRIPLNTGGSGSGSSGGNTLNIPQ